MKNNAILIIIFLTILIIVATFILSKNHVANNFNRILIYPKITLKNEIELNDNSFGFAGKVGSFIPLLKYSDGIHLFKIDLSLNTIDTLSISYSKGFNKNTLNIYKDVLSNHIFCTNPFGDILVNDGQSIKYFKLPNFRFDVVKAISEESIIVRIRYKNKSSLNRSLTKLLLSDSVKMVKDYQLPEVSNGFFANDGILSIDKQSSRILYMYFYRGEILCLDTNLNKKFVLKTIDTIRTAKLEMGLSVTKGKDAKISKLLVQRTPPKFVNVSITTDSNKVFVLSRLKADNETDEEFNKNQVVDVYSLINGAYTNSFYIPKYKGRSLRQFQIKGSQFIAIFGTTLLIYEISH